MPSNAPLAAMMVVWCLALAATLSLVVWLMPENGSRRFGIYDMGDGVVIFGEFDSVIHYFFHDSRLNVGYPGSPGMEVELRHTYDGDVFALDAGWLTTQNYPHKMEWRFWKFEAVFFNFSSRDGNETNYREIRVRVPCWFVVLALSAYPALTFLRGPVRRWNRRRHGRCVKCAYDLTGLAEPRCPECGRKIEERMLKIEDNTS